MSDERRDETLSAQDEAWVRGVRAAYRRPAPTAAERTAFNARLDARIASEGSRGRLSLGLVATATAALALALWLAPTGPGESPQATPIGDTGDTVALAAPATTPEEAFLSLVESETDLDDSLPADFAAIESLLLGG